MNNALAYDLYKMAQRYDLDFAIAKDLIEKFDLFYELLEKENFESCNHLLNEIRGLMGGDHPDIITASVTLDFEETWDIE